MPFLSSSPFDQAVVKATSEMNTTEDWETIMDICDKVQVTKNGPQDCLRSIVKRLSGDPHHILHALTLLDACIQNCGKKFHIEVCSSSFEIEVKKLLMKSHPKVLEKLKMYLQKWSDNFNNDPELSSIPKLYNSIKSEIGEGFEVQKQASKTSFQKPKDASDKEYDDLAKAIQLSLKETAGSSSVSPLYPSVCNSVPALKTEKRQEPRKVRAIYDFEAAEDNELTFQAGEVIMVIDDTDRNWWKGSNHGGEGLFPSNFTAEFSEHENKVHEKRKSVKFDDDVTVKTLHTDPLDVEIVIDESKITSLLHLLHEADPTGHQPDTAELQALEENCLAMGPLIDKQLVLIDRRHASLTAANNGLVESLNAYEALMKDYSAMPYSPYPAADVMQGGYPPHSPPLHAHGFGVRAYLPAETYQPLPVPTSSEHFQVPLAGALPTLQSRIMQSGQRPHISYGTTNLNSCIPQGSVATTGGNFAASLPSREPSGIYYGDVVSNSMQHNTTSISMQHQPML